MTDAIAQAAEQLQHTDAQQAQGEAGKPLLPESNPQSAASTGLSDSSSDTSNLSPAIPVPQTPTTLNESSAPAEAPKPVEAAAGATAVSESAPPASAESTGVETGEHPHTPILRKIVSCLRRDFSLLSGELESWVKEAERHL